MNNKTSSDRNLLFFATSSGRTAFDYANSLVDADPTQAIRYYEISGNMSNSKAFYLAGKVSVKLKDYEKAAILFEKGRKQEHSLSALEPHNILLILNECGQS